MKFRSILPFFILVLANPFFSYGTTAAQKSDTLAVINGTPVTSGEFKTRFEMSVYPGKGLEDNLYQAKRGFLYSIVAERLLSAAALKDIPGIDKNDEDLKRNIERIFLRDALYRKEILPKAKVSESEIDKGIKISSYFYVVNAFYFPDSISAQNFYDETHAEKNGADFHKLADSLKVRHDTLEIGYGESNDNIEDAFFGHKTGFSSKPTLTVDGWVIFKIVKKILNKKFASAAPEDRRELVRKVIRGRKEDKLGYEYLMKVMKGVTVNVNYNIFRPLVHSIYDMLKTHHPEKFDPYYYLSAAEIVKIKEEFAKYLNEPMLKFGEGDINLETVLDNLTSAGFAAERANIDEITVALHSALKFMVQNHFLAEKARELGLQNSSEVKYNVSTFLNAYRSQKMASAILDTVKVTREETDNYFRTHKDEVLRDIKLRLQIFKVDNLDRAAEIMNRLNGMKKRNEDTSGSVWMRASELGELGAVLAELNYGDIYGPVFVKNTYTIFRVLNKKSLVSETAVKKSIQVARDMLLAKRRRDVLDKYITKLAGEENVKLYPDRLKDVSVTPIQMVTFRYIGFGGKIMAVPMLYPREGWIKEFKKNGSVLP